MDNSMSDYLTSKEFENAELLVEKHKDEVLLFLLEKGVSYPTEISRHIALHIETTNQVLSYLLRCKFVEKVIPDRWHPQSIFNVRIPEFWAMGMDSYDKLGRCSWWTLTLGGLEYIKAKYKGQHKQIRGSLITYLCGEDKLREVSGDDSP